MAWQPGTKLYGDRYIIIKKLEEGGFGTPYLARNQKGEDVVIKTLRADLLTNPDYFEFRDKYLQNFEKEASRLAVCRHPHIGEIAHVFWEDSLPCIVMEYIAGQNLWELVRAKGAFPEAEAVRYIQQIGNGLTVVHNKGLLHRDIKPHNIMKRDGKPEAVLINLGIAKEFIPNLTQTDTIAFTHGFAPIEQYNKQAHRNESTDVYSLSATLYYLLTGKVPPPAFRRTFQDTLKPLNQAVNVSNRVHEAVMIGLEIQPNERFQSVSDWLGRVVQQGTDPTQYQKLEQLLATGQWKEADQETTRLMLQIAGREEQGYLGCLNYDDINKYYEDINKFPCEDLRIIDQLWSKYSMFRFGFSVQKQIWLEVGGKIDENTEYKLGDRLGWIGNESYNYGNWINYDNLTFSLQAPVGHLPSVVWFVRDGCAVRFFSRIKNCKLYPLKISTPCQV